MWASLLTEESLAFRTEAKRVASMVETDVVTYKFLSDVAHSDKSFDEPVAAALKSREAVLYALISRGTLPA